MKAIPSDLIADLSYRPDTGELFWLDGHRSDTISIKGYRYVSRLGELFAAHRIVWVMNGGPNCELDHIDGDPGNNKLSNLRAASRSENQANRRRGTNNTSGVKGVTWNKAKRKWCAQLMFRGERKHYSYHASIEEAQQAYLLAAKLHHKEFARQ